MELASMTVAPHARASSIALAWVLGLALPSKIAASQPRALAASTAASAGTWQPLSVAEQLTIASLTPLGAFAGSVGPGKSLVAAIADAGHPTIARNAATKVVRPMWRLPVVVALPTPIATGFSISWYPPY